jgi:hypothetical protein
VSGEEHCRLCGTSEDEHLRITGGGFRNATAGLMCWDEDACAVRAAHAAGYAEAVGDIRQMLHDEMPSWGDALDLLDEGAHVGAAKRGAE